MSCCQVMPSGQHVGVELQGHKGSWCRCWFVQRWQIQGKYWVREASGATRVRTLYHSQKVTVAAMQIAEKKVCAQRS